MAKIEIGKEASLDVINKPLDNTIRIFNDMDQLVACLYVLPDGNLHQDSWIHDNVLNCGEDK